MPAPVEECVGKYTLFASLYVKFFCQPRREAKLAINKYLCISLFFEKQQLRTNAPVQELFISSWRLHKRKG